LTIRAGLSVDGRCLVATELAAVLFQEGHRKKCGKFTQRAPNAYGAFTPTADNIPRSPRALHGRAMVAIVIVPQLDVVTRSFGDELLDDLRPLTPVADRGQGRRADAWSHAS
jgi:hypothetical protein